MRKQLQQETNIGDATHTEDTTNTTNELQNRHGQSLSKLQATNGEKTSKQTIANQYFTRR